MNINEISKKIEGKESLVKGRIGEALVKELFIMLKMDVYPYGVECQFPQLARLHQNGKLQKNIALKSIANQPDFVVCTNHLDKAVVHRVEVKFRTNGKIKISELSDYDDDVIFVFMDMETFYVLEKSDLQKKYKGRTTLSFDKLTRLSQDSVFAFEPWQKKTVYEFSQYVSKYLGSPHLVGQMKSIKLPKKKSTPILKRILKRLSA